MHFLCLHGWGTNSEVLESQLRAIRYELGDGHTYDYVDGMVPATIAKEIEGIFPKTDEYFTYFNDDASSKKAVQDLRNFLKREGPFDGIIGFSIGALLAGAMLIQDSRSGALNPDLKVAIFFSPPAVDWVSSISKEDEGLIHIPTAHIWASNDETSLDGPKVIASLCAPDMRSIFVHDVSHAIPGDRDIQAVTDAVHTIRRAINAV
ncbi:hypothetical protein ACHAQE_003391 [Botrytis cinerea]